MYITLKQVLIEVLCSGTKWSHDSWTVTDLEGVGRDGFMEEVTSELDCEKAGRHFKKRKGRE